MTDAQTVAIIAAIIRESHGGCDVKEAVEAGQEYLKEAKEKVGILGS